jgi:general secretion pathway protein C
VAGTSLAIQAVRGSDLQLSWQPKRVRILIVLLTLGLCAFFLAQGSTNLLALKLMPLRPPTLNVEVGPPGIAPEHLPKGELPPDMHAILARNIFDPLTGSLWPPKTPELTASTSVEQETAAAPLGAGQMPPPCDGTVRLVASMFSARNEAWSFASLALGTGSPLLYRPGTSVEGKSVDSVYPEAVFLKSPNGVLCSLTMFKSPNQPPKPAAVAAAAAPTDPAAAGDAELDQGIKQQSETKYTVRRSLVDKLLQNQAELMRSARVVPHEENGRVVGVKLYGIRKTSLLGKLGLQNGDMLRTINGFDMGSPDSALEAYAKLRSASNLSLAVVRRGNAVTMEYNIAQ